MSTPRDERRDPDLPFDAVRYHAQARIRRRYSRGARWPQRGRGGTTNPAALDPNLTARRPLYFAVFFCVVCAIVLAQTLFLVAALLLLMLAVVPELWYRFGGKGLVITRELDQTRVAFGERITVREQVENRSPLPLPWLEIDDELPEELPLLNARVEPSPKSRRVVLAGVHALWAYQRVRRRYHLLGCARGAFVFGPARAILVDPFGLLTREVDLPATTALLVHPIVAPLERFGLQPDAPFGEQKSRRRLLEDPLRVAGTREYMPGDEPRRIHWKATARTGTLQSKVYEPSTRRTLAIFLDTRTYIHLQMGYDPALAELAICAAASVAQWGIERGYATGIYSNGAVSSEGADGEAAQRLAAKGDETAGGESDQRQRLAQAIARYSGLLRLRLPPAAREEQLVRMLDGLARVLPYAGVPMAQTLAGELRHLPPGSTVVYIGVDTVVDVPLIVALRRARALGHSVSLLLVRGGRGSETGDESSAGDGLHLSGLNAHIIGGRETWQELRLDALGPDGVRLADEAEHFKLGTMAPPDGVQRDPISRPEQHGGDDRAEEATQGVRDDTGTRPAGAGSQGSGRRALVVE